MDRIQRKGSAVSGLPAPWIGLQDKFCSQSTRLIVIPDFIRLLFANIRPASPVSMENCCLQPPNVETLSDAVIDNVVQRAGTEDKGRDSTQNRNFVAFASPADPERRQAERIRLTKLASAVIDSDRERRCLNQERYRKKQHKRMLDLEDDTKRLGGEILDLGVRLQSLLAGIPTKQTLWTVASEYFRAFTYNFRSISKARRSLMLKFLEETMSPDVTDGFVFGATAIVENWQSYLIRFDGIDVHLDHLHKISADSLVAVTTTSITISKHTLRQVFPHLKCDGKEGDNADERSSLATKLLDQKIVMRGSVRFNWDNESERVTRLQTQSDMLTPLLCLLGTLEDVAHVFDNALIAPDFRLVPNVSLR